MSRYSGRQGRGAARLVRELKRDQAEERNEHHQKTQRAAQQDQLVINYSGNSLLDPHGSQVQT